MTPSKPQRSKQPSLLKVSILVPAYNAAGTIAETLQSILSQGYGDWEAIVVNDGSTDATAKIAQRFVKRFYFRCNVSAFVANRGDVLPNQFEEAVALPAIEPHDRG